MQEKIWILSIESLDENDQPQTLRFSSARYTSPEGDYYDVRLKQPCLFSTNAFTGSVINTASRSGYGEAVLLNLDQGLNYIADHSVNGRKLSLKLVEEGVDREIVSGTVRNIVFNDGTVSIRLRDFQEQLDEADPEVYYKGNNISPNGVEGTPDGLLGSIKPKVFGSVSNAEPYLVNPVKLIYEYDSLSRPAILNAVYDRGVALSFHRSVTTLSELYDIVVPSGKYVIHKGFFKLGAPPTGTVTFDAEGVYSKAGDVFSNIASRQGFFVDGTSVSLLNTTGVIGLYIKETVNTSQILDDICISCGAYWSFTSTGDIFVRLLEKPELETTLNIFPYSIISIQRTSIGSGENGVPVYKFETEYDSIETVQTDLAAIVSDSRKERLANQFRTFVVENQSVKKRNPLAEPVKIKSLFRNKQSAEVMSNRLLTLFQVRRDRVSAELRLDQETVSALNIGKTVKIYSEKLGYDAGANFVILGYTIDAKLNKVSIDLWGYTNGSGSFNLKVSENGSVLLIDNKYGYLLTSDINTVKMNSILKTNNGALLIGPDYKLAIE